MAKRGTKTSSFGVSKRESHDSSRFYESNLYAHINTAETGDVETPPDDPSWANKIYTADSRDMSFIPDESVALMVTSPPYNVTKEYDDDLSLSDYLDLLRDVFAETKRVLVPGGRMCINVAGLGRKPYIPLHHYIGRICTHDLGLLMRGEIIWDKSASAGSSCAWGSWASPTNPTLRDVHEYILIFSKGKFKRDALGREGDITRDNFLEYTKSIWAFPTERASKVGHPAPFPVELPRRLIRLYTFPGDVVLDPFCGSGTTCVAAAEESRMWLGVDVSEEYCETARARLGEMLKC